MSDFVLPLPKHETAVAVHGAAVHEHAPASSLSRNRVGLWWFILSECFLFLAFISARYYLLGLERPAELNQALGLGLSLLLLVSSLTAYRAELGAQHGDRRRLLRNTATTILLGLVFLMGVGYEWSEALVHFPPSEAFGTVFFSLTGLHAFHVLSGVVLLALVYWNARRGRYDSGSIWGVEASVKYWHFVDVAWVFIYPTLYLVR
ncbi:MAG: heme-copper oxidase subunit III [Chloroflexi bacterium]|nr:heme-copper oxidase subunit III [Chloroflexota bacterium]